MTRNGYYMVIVYDLDNGDGNENSKQKTLLRYKSYNDCIVVYKDNNSLFFSDKRRYNSILLLKNCA